MQGGMEGGECWLHSIGSCTRLLTQPPLFHTLPPLSAAAAGQLPRRPLLPAHHPLAARHPNSLKGAHTDTVVKGESFCVTGSAWAAPASTKAAQRSRAAARMGWLREGAGCPCVWRLAR